MADEDDIEVRAILKDELSGPARRAAAAIDELGDEALETAAELEAMGAAADDAGRDLSGLDKDARKAQLGLEAQRRAMKMNRDELGRFRKEHEKTERETRRHSRTVDAFINVGNKFNKAFKNMKFSGFFRGAGKLLFGLVAFFPILIGKVLEFGRTMKTAFDESLKNGSSVFRASMAGIIAGLESGGAAFIMFAVVVAGTTAVIGIVAAGLSLLLGIIVALVASLTFGLIAAVAALAGVLAVAVGGIGIAVAAFLALDDAQKKALKADIKPLVNQFKALGKAAGRGVFSNVAEQAKRLTPVIAKLEPLFFRVGHAISNIGDYFITALRGPGFSGFMKAMTKFLPKAVESLGRSLGNTLGGLGGLFVGAIPLIQDFLGWVEGVTSEFAEWANSAGGREAIVKFLERAADSAKAVGNFLKEAGDFLWTLLDAGASSGDSIFQSMADGIKDATQWLDKNKDSLATWFGYAVVAASFIGMLIEAVVELFDALDTPGTRKAFLAWLMGMSALLRGAAAAVRWMGDAFSWTMGVIGRFAGFVGGVVSSVIGFFQKLPGRIRAYLALIPALFIAVFQSLPGLAVRAVTAVIRQFMRVPGRIRAAVAPIGRILQRIWQRIPGPVQRSITQVVRFFRTLPGRIAGAIASIPGRVQRLFARLGPLASRIVSNIVKFFRALPGRVGGAIAGLPGRARAIFNRLGPIATSIITRIVGFFRALPGRIGGAVAGVVAAVRGHFDGIVNAVSGIPGRIVGLFSGLGGRIANAIGSINLPMPHLPDIPGVPGIYTGGQVHSGLTALVGEQGPEAFVDRAGNIDMIGKNGPELMTFSKSGAVVPTAATMDPFGGFSDQAPDWAVKTLQKAAQGSTDKVVARAVPQPKEKKEVQPAPINVGPIYATSDVDVERAVRRAIRDEQRNREERS